MDRRKTRKADAARRLAWARENLQKLDRWSETALVLEMRKLGLFQVKGGIGAGNGQADTSKQIGYLRLLKKKVLTVASV